jgi:hypothetical protein
MATTNPSQDARCKKEVTSAAPGLVCVCVWQFCKELNGPASVLRGVLIPFLSDKKNLILSLNFVG